jgi:hypothetical protein
LHSTARRQLEETIVAGTLTLQVGQVFTGGTSVSPGDTGMVAFADAGYVTFNTVVSPPRIASLEITQESAASSESANGVVIESVTIDSVTPNSLFTIIRDELGGPTSPVIPSGFVVPQTVTGTTFGLTFTTSEGTFDQAGEVFATAGPLEAVFVGTIHAFGVTLEPGPMILSLGTQATGAVTESFAPAFTPACFAAGTRIRTEAGDLPVEALRAGDRVLCANGSIQTVTWLGHRWVECGRHPRPRDIWPVRVSPGAFRANQPCRDLWLSPDHAVFVGGVLIPVRYLVNGATVVQEAKDSIEYWHVELERHSVILADGMPCESYLDTGNRAAFANGGNSVQFHPDFARRAWETCACAPLVLNGPRLIEAKRRLLARATALGHAIDDNPDLKVLIDGRKAQAETNGQRWRVPLPEEVVSCQLTSRVWVPAHTRPDEVDERPLGVAISRVWLDGREVSLDSQGLSAGWHALEAGWRWTDGDATLALAGIRELAFDVALVGTYWREQERREVEAAYAASDGSQRRRCIHASASTRGTTSRASMSASRAASNWEASGSWE